MPTNYKYIDHEKAQRGGRWSRRFFLLFLLILILAGSLYGTYFFQTRKAEELILTGQYSAAETKLDHWKWLPVVSGRVYEKLGTAHLLEHGASEATAYFTNAEGRPLYRPASIWHDVLKILWAGGRYDDGLVYANHIERAIHDEPVLHYYKAGFLTGANNLPEASKELEAAGNIPEFTKELALLKTEIDQRTRTNQQPFLFDRENLPLVNLDQKGDPVFLVDAVQPVLKNLSYDFLSKIPDHKNQAVLSVDYRIQNAALKALGKYAGAIVVLDVKGGDILAAASSLKGVNSSYPDGTQLALTQMYEPGSIIKMITLAGGLEKGVDLTKIFPLQCDGILKLSEDKVLSDWKKHDAVKDIYQATAVSCNVAFAKIGLALKPADLIGNLKQFGFNGRLQSGLLPLELGKIKDGDFNDLYLANCSIGLENLQMTPLHAAMLAASIANHGTSITPRMLLGYRNIIGLPFGAQPSVEFHKVMSEQSAATITQAMQEVVKNADGTGRRAAIDNFSFAMKTGTSGDGALGYNAIVIGFAPVPDPKIAFAIVLEHAGKSEFEGARITKLLLQSIQGYI